MFGSICINVVVVVWEVVFDVEEVLLEGDGVCFGFRKFG